MGFDGEAGSVQGESLGSGLSMATMLKRFSNNYKMSLKFSANVGLCEFIVWASDVNR